MEGLGSKRALLLTLLLDAGISLATYLLAFRIRLVFGAITAANWIPFEHALPYFVMISLVIHALFGVYQPQLNREESQATVMSSSLANLVAVMALSYIVGALAIPRSVLVIGALLQAVFLILTHRWMTGTFQKFPQHLVDLHDVEAVTLADDLARDEVCINADPLSILLTGARLTRSPEYGAHLTLPPVGLSPGTRMVKRVLDTLLALIFGAIALALSVPIALAILVDSGRPILYRQDRVGRLGRIFKVVKFRTMKRGAEDDTGPTLSWDQDERLTRVGRFLRATRMDELPQLWNILKGEMSFVGPRPERPQFVDRYLREYPFYALRFRVKPGLTGIAQIYGTYGLPAHEKLKYDLYYLTHHSVALDFLILLRTLSIPLQPWKARGRAIEQRSVQKDPVPVAKEDRSTSRHHTVPLRSDRFNTNWRP